MSLILRVFIYVSSLAFGLAGIAALTAREPSYSQEEYGCDLNWAMSLGPKSGVGVMQFSPGQTGVRAGVGRSWPHDTETLFYWQTSRFSRSRLFAIPVRLDVLCFTGALILWTAGTVLWPVRKRESPVAPAGRNDVRGDVF